jgi:hypothetical protein
MRVSGRKLRLAVGTGFAALMLTIGVSSVGATAPGTIGNVNVIGTSGGTSAIGTSNTTTTVATYRDAVRITNTLSGAGGLAGNYDECMYNETSAVNVNQGTPQQPSGNLSSTDITPSVCGLTNPIIQPAAYPLWVIETGTTTGSGSVGSGPSFLVPDTNGGNPAKSYVIETFR